MRRAIIVTKTASNSVINRYKGSNIIVLSNNKGEIIEDYQEIKNAIDELFHKGFDEISILCSKGDSVLTSMSFVYLFKCFPHIKLEIVLDNEIVSYYEKGTYVINKGMSKELALFALKPSLITIDYFNETLKHYTLDDSNPYVKGLIITNRIGVLNVEKGEVLLIKKEGDNYA